jgi:hypothetical protein
MALKIEQTDWGVTPVIMCDHCGEPIGDARDGNYQWQAGEGDPGTDGPLRRFAFFTHKACSGPFEQSRGGASEWYAMELSELLPALAARLRLVGHLG